MADTLAEFYGRLGALAETDASCGCDLGDAAEATADASLTVSKIASQYVALSTQGENLRQIMTTGVTIPCEVWEAYAAARQDYLTKSQSVFDQLAAKGVTVEQVLYSGGKPQPDPTDATRYATVRVQAPLRPPAFVGINQQCPTVPNMSGAGAVGSLGWERTPLMAGAVSAAALAALGGSVQTMLILLSGGSPLGLAGVGAYQTIKQVAVLWSDYDASPSRTLAAYTACFQAAVRAGAKAADANKQCAGVQASAVAAAKAGTPPPAPGAGMGFFSWLGIIVGVAVVGTIAIRLMRSGPARLGGTPPPRGHYSAPDDPIFLGDLYLRPRGRRRG